jgi:AcrR family transcriptional regulator
MTTRIKGARMNPLARKEQILDTAINLSIEKGYRQLTRRAVANRMQCASALINHYFKDIENLRHIVLLTAIEKEILPILAENYAAWGVETAELPQQLKEKVIRYLTN